MSEAERTVIPLTYPVSDGEKTITELALRRPRAADIKDFPAEPTMGDMLRLVGRLSGQFEYMIDRLDLSDATRVLAVVQAFFTPGPPTGETPSS